MYDLNVLNEAVPNELKTSRFLLCDLTPDEQRERGLQLANIASEIDTLEEEAKRVAGEFKTSILEAKGRYGSVKNAVLTRREYRDVSCTEYVNTKRAEVYTLRDDLNVIVEARQMTDRERQLHLPNVEVPTDSEDREEVQATAGNGKITDPEGNGHASDSPIEPIRETVAKRRSRSASART